MPRPRQCRWVRFGPKVTYFKPRGIPLHALEEIDLGVDELEAIRLVDLESKEQTEAAHIMNISQPTLHRILKEARTKIADAIVSGKALCIGGGDYILIQRLFVCHNCDYEWELPYGEGRPQTCPKCGSPHIARVFHNRGPNRGGRGLKGHGWKGPRL
ncbi:MAG: DUF134 domain-containing protein [Theionarchaea archaeon]|nr:DUF134 domain-containing protein [Theionarchaea archaeon]